MQQTLSLCDIIRMCVWEIFGIAIVVVVGGGGSGGGGATVVLYLLFLGYPSLCITAVFSFSISIFFIFVLALWEYYV